jgi:hypothetical protein
MREAILEAVASGRLEDLRIAVELNEIRPIVGDGTLPDAIAQLRAMSSDGEGSDVLAALGRILATSWIAIPGGPDIENNHIYVWPRVAMTGIAAADNDAAAELAIIGDSSAVAAMRKSGVYTGWRIGIGADGTWHYLRR